MQCARFVVCMRVYVVSVRLGAKANNVLVYTNRIHTIRARKYQTYLLATHTFRKSFKVFLMRSTSSLYR